jgi:hypothetical protein
VLCARGTEGATNAWRPAKVARAPGCLSPRPSRARPSPAPSPSPHRSSLAPVLAAIGRHPSLAALTLERCELGDSAAAALRQILAAPGAAPQPRAQGGGGAADDSASARPAGCLRALRVVRCSLPASAGATLADGVAGARGLRVFAFSGNAVEPAAGRATVAGAFAGALRRGAAGLRHFTLGFSRGCPITAEVLAGVVASGAAPAGLRHVVLHRREVSPRGLQAWADALACDSTGGAAAQPPALTLRTLAAGYEPAQPGQASRGVSRAPGGGVDGGGGGGNAGSTVSTSGGDASRRVSTSGGDAVGSGEVHAGALGTGGAGGGGAAASAVVPAPAPAPRHRVLVVEGAPIAFVVNAEQDAPFQEAWVAALPALPLPPMAQAAAAGRGGRPRLVVLSPGDAGETVACALKGLALGAIDLHGVHLGPRVSRLGAAWGSSAGLHRAGVAPRGASLGSGASSPAQCGPATAPLRRLAAVPHLNPGEPRSRRGAPAGRSAAGRGPVGHGHGGRGGAGAGRRAAILPRP